MHPLLIARVSASMWPLDSVHILILEVSSLYGHAFVNPHACEIYCDRIFTFLVLKCSTLNYCTLNYWFSGGCFRSGRADSNCHSLTGASEILEGQGDHWSSSRTLSFSIFYTKSGVQLWLECWTTR